MTLDQQARMDEFDTKAIGIAKAIHKVLFAELANAGLNGRTAIALATHQALTLVCASLIPASTRAIMGELPKPTEDLDTKHFSHLLFHNCCLALHRNEPLSFGALVMQTTRQFAVEQHQLSPFGEALEAFVNKHKPGAK
jgi:hypothetical protein